MATYVNDLRLTELATGEGSGTWGVTTNTNLELVAEAFSFGTEAITTNADTHTTTIADGSTDPGRSMFLKYTGTLDSTCTITIGPNTVSKLWFIENATSGSQSIIIKQGSGATVTIANGQTKAIYSDGAGSGGAMIDAFTDLSVPSLFVSGDLDVDGTTNLDVVDIDGAVDFASTTAHAGNASFADNARVILGTGSDLQLYHDGSHSYIEDAAGTGNLKLRTNTLRIENAAGTELSATFVQDGAATLYNDNSIKLATTSTGIDVTGVITTDGMTTSADINFGDNDKAVFGAGSDLEIFHDGTDSFISESNASGSLFIKATHLYLQNSSGQDALNLINGNAFLKSGGSTKLETTSTGIDVTGVITTDGLTTSADINFGDDDKAVFGAGSDLEIFHESSTGRSFIKETGSDEFRILGSDIRIKNGGDSKTYMQMTDGGSVAIRHNDATKLETSSTGIDVTGTAVTDGLTVDGNSSFAGTFQISGASPKIFLSETDTTDLNTRMRNAAGKLQIQTVDNSDANPKTRFQIDHSTGDISFFEDTGTTAKFFFDASEERLGIGNSSPSTALDVTGVITTDGMTTSADINFGDDDKAVFGAGSDLLIFHDGSDSHIRDQGTGNLIIRGNNLSLQSFGAASYLEAAVSGAVELYHNGNKKLETNSTGIDVTGTAVTDGLTVQGASDSTLLVEATGGNDASLFLTEAGTGNVGAQFVYDGGVNELFLKVGNNTDTTRFSVSRDTGDISFYEDTGTTAKMFWDSSAESLGIGTTSPARLLTIESSNPRFRISDSDGGYAEMSGNGGHLSLQADPGNTQTGSRIDFEVDGSQKARLDSSGNLLVGTTTASPQNFTSGSGSQISDGFIAVARGGTVALFNRVSTDGDIADFRKDGTSVGTIGAGGGDLTIGTGDTGLTFEDAADVIHPINAGTGAARDAAIDLGKSAAQFKDLYLSGDVFATNIKGQNDTNTKIEFLGSDVTRFVQGGSEKVRINTAGDLLVGKTSSSTSTAGFEARDDGQTVATVDGGTAIIANRKTSDGDVIRVMKDGTIVGSISVSGSSTAYNTSSDQRLKDNIVDAPSPSDDIDAIQVRSFDWKATGSHQKYGMVAQELSSVAPEAVTGDADSDEMMGVDYSKLVPMMMKEIQSLRARVAQLEGEN